MSWNRNYATGQYSDSESDDDPVTEDLEGDEGFNRATSPVACDGPPVDESQSASAESTQHVVVPITPLGQVQVWKTLCTLLNLFLV